MIYSGYEICQESTGLPADQRHNRLKKAKENSNPQGIS
jgi:hypothetical protein